MRLCLSGESRLFSLFLSFVSYAHAEAHFYFSPLSPCSEPTRLAAPFLRLSAPFRPDSKALNISGVLRRVCNIFLPVSGFALPVSALTPGLLMAALGLTVCVASWPAASCTHTMWQCVTELMGFVRWLLQKILQKMSAENVWKRERGDIRHKRNVAHMLSWRLACPLGSYVQKVHVAAYDCIANCSLERSMQHYHKILFPVVTRPPMAAYQSDSCQILKD